MAPHVPPTRIPTLDDVAWQDRRVIARVDINAPIENGRVAGRTRLNGAAATLKRLLDAGAGVTVLAHQGRPGKPDFVSRAQHAAILGELLGQQPRFVDHVGDDEALAAMQRVRPGDLVVLENVRQAEGEMENVPAEQHAERTWVKRMAGEAAAFVSDAFSAAHRSHASLVGFPLLLPSCAGPGLAAELEALERVIHDGDGERVIVLGGAKVEDALKVLNHHLEGGLVDTALVGGLVGELFLVARGHNLGATTDQVLERAGATAFLPLAEALVGKYDPQIVTPEDVACEQAHERHDLFIEELPSAHKLLDIGPETAKTFASTIENAENVVLNGPMGAYEQTGFDLGTRAVLEACANTKAFTLLGGGHTLTALERLGLEEDRFGHVSLAGGALTTFLTGEPLPGIEALRESARRFALAP